MKKAIFALLVVLLFPMIIFASGNVAKIGDNEYATLSAAVDAAASGDTITLLQNVTGEDLTLNSGITLIVPEGITLTIKGDNVVKNGATVNNNGVIVVDDGVMDTSTLASSETTGLILGQAGTVSIKSNGQLILPSVWHTKWQSQIGLWQPNGAYATHIFGTLENGASLVINNNSYVYDSASSSWKGSILVGETNYTTLKDAVDSISTSGTVKLLSNIYIPSATTVITGKTVTINLNGFNINAVNKVLTVDGGKLELTGSGSVIETTPDYAPIYVKGSTNQSNTEYSVVTVGKDVTLIGWAGVFITQNGTQACGVVINFNGTIINNKFDTSSVPLKGHGIYINGTIQDKANYPIININNGAKITSTVGEGIYAAGYAKWNITGAAITGSSSGIGLKAGIFNIKDSTITGTGNYVADVTNYGNGIHESGAGLQIETNSGYAGGIEIELTNSTIKSDKGYSIYEYGSSTTTNIEKIAINSGKFVSYLTFESVFKLSDGFDIAKFVTTGTYSADPSAYVADGSKVVYDATDKMYVVTKAKFVTGTYAVSGTVANTEGATVLLKQGAIVVKSTLTDENYAYSFVNLKNGLYNLEFAKDNQKLTKLIEVKDGNVILDVTLPTYRSVLEFENTAFDSVLVSNLDSIATSSQDSAVLLVKDIDTTDNSVVSEKTAITNIATGKDLSFLNIDLWIGDGTPEDISQYGVLEVIIPYDLVKNKNVVVYRYHDEAAEAFTKLTEKPSTLADKTYYLDETNNLIHIYTSKFSTYAIGQDHIDNPVTGDATTIYVFIGLISLIGIVGATMHFKKREVINR